MASGASREEVIERRLAQLRQMGAEYAEAKATCVRLEEFKKSKLAILMKKYEAAGVTTAAGQERDARADPEYLELIEGLYAATEKMERMRWEMNVAQLGAEVWRTLESSRRAEAGLY